MCHVVKPRRVASRIYHVPAAELVFIVLKDARVTPADKAFFFIKPREIDETNVWWHREKKVYCKLKIVQTKK